MIVKITLRTFVILLLISLLGCDNNKSYVNNIDKYIATIDASINNDKAFPKTTEITKFYSKHLIDKTTKKLYRVIESSYNYYPETITKYYYKNDRLIHIDYSIGNWKLDEFVINFNQKFYFKEDQTFIYSNKKIKIPFKSLKDRGIKYLNDYK